MKVTLTLNSNEVAALGDALELADAAMKKEESLK